MPPAAVYRSGRIIRRAQIDDIRLYRRIRKRKESVLLTGFGVNHLTSQHDISILVDRINRIRDHNRVVQRKDIQQISQIALRAVTDKDLIHIQRYTVSLIICLHGLPQEIVALFRTVSAEGRLASHLFYRIFHRLDNNRRQRKRYIADTQPDDFFLRMRLLILPLLSGNR